ncbi:uncharacterized protein PHACADRAFT_103813, partial [Phanerochaete carnosa HHB-10118-sp]
SQRSITVAAANYPGGIRCYTKTPGGEVREASLEFSDYVLSKAMGNGTSDVLASGAGWKSSTSPFKCHPQSALCTVSWDEKGQSVFYQDEAGTLREQRSTESKGWKQTDLNQKNIKLGSKIAAVSSPKQAKVILFYQNVHDNICALCVSRAVLWEYCLTLAQNLREWPLEGFYCAALRCGLCLHRHWRR